MGSSPDPQDYEPSETEKASAAVAMAEHKYFKEKYDPLLQKMRDASKTDDSGKILRGRANADTMQALAGKASYDRATRAEAGGDMAQAYQAQLGQADKAGLDIKNKMQLGVLGTARGQAADAQTGMAAAADMGTSQALTKAAAKQEVRSAKVGALAQLGSAFILQGAENMKSETPDGSMVDGKFVPKLDAQGNQIMKKGSFLTPAGGRPDILGGIFNFGGGS